MASRLSPALLVVVSALGVGLLGGCQRGCLSSWFKAQGIDQAASGLGGKGGPLAPTESPCPGGLARCSGGIVRVSRSFTPPGPCGPEGCKCPWEDAKTCEDGCALEAIELDMPPETAARQLCAPAPGAPAFARDPGPDAGRERGPDAGRDPGRDAGRDPAEDDEEGDAICDVERYVCVRGVVVACPRDGVGAHAVGACIQGCADGERMLFAESSDRIAMAILCRR
jgi:hypothetical protein